MYVISLYAGWSDLFWRPKKEAIVYVLIVLMKVELFI